MCQRDYHHFLPSLLLPFLNFFFPLACTEGWQEGGVDTPTARGEKSNILFVNLMAPTREKTLGLWNNYAYLLTFLIPESFVVVMYRASVEGFVSILNYSKSNQKRYVISIPRCSQLCNTILVARKQNFIVLTVKDVFFMFVYFWLLWVQQIPCHVPSSQVKNVVRERSFLFFFFSHEEYFYTARLGVSGGSVTPPASVLTFQLNSKKTNVSWS